MKKLFFIFLSFVCVTVKAQSIVAGAGNASASVDDGGKIYINGVQKGQILTNGHIVNMSQNVIGYVHENGKIENAAQVLVGYFMGNYEIHNASHQLIGRFTSTREIKNTSETVLGNWQPPVNPSWVAVAYFFFQE